MEEKKKEEYKLVTVPTGQAIAIESPDGNILSQEQALVEILNFVKEIKKAFVG